MALNKFNLLLKKYDLSEEDIPFLDILCEFVDCCDIEGYDCDMYYEIYSHSNVYARQDSIDDYISDYINDYDNEISEKEDDEDIT